MPATGIEPVQQNPAKMLILRDRRIYAVFWCLYIFSLCKYIVKIQPYARRCKTKCKMKKRAPESAQKSERRKYDNGYLLYLRQMFCPK